MSLSINDIIDQQLNLIENTTISNSCSLEGVPIFYESLSISYGNSISEYRFNEFSDINPYVRRSQKIITLVGARFASDSGGLINSSLRESPQTILSLLNNLQLQGSPLVLVSPLINGFVLLEGVEIVNANADKVFNLQLRFLETTTDSLTNEFINGVENDIYATVNEDVPINVLTELIPAPIRFATSDVTNLTKNAYNRYIRDKTALRTFNIDINKDKGDVSYLSFQIPINGTTLPINYSITDSNITLWYPERVLYNTSTRSPVEFFIYNLNGVEYVLQFYSKTKIDFNNNTAFVNYKLGVYV